MKKINTEVFLEELDHYFRGEIAENSELGDTVLHEDLTVADAMVMLKDLNTESTLASDIRYAISSACLNCSESFVFEELSKLSLVDESIEEEYNSSESEGVVNYDKENDEFYFTGRIKTFARLYPSFSESALRDEERLETELSELVKCAVERINEVQNEIILEGD